MPKVKTKTKASKVEESEKKGKAKPESRPYKKAMIHPHVPLEHFEMCGFSDPICIFDQNSPGHKSVYDLLEFDIIDGVDNIERGHVAYEDILLQKMMALYDDKREEFMTYQASLHKDPKLWLDDLRRFWTNFRKHIVELEDREFYDEYLAIIDKVSGKRIKKYAPFKWGEIQPSQLMELILALEAVKFIEYDTSAYTQNEMIEAVANRFGVEFSKLDNIKKNIITRKRSKTVFLDAMATELVKHLQELERKHSI